ncbi:putative transcriptional regulator [Bacillus sp. TS-2]|nr:putative transcriptional regulator [Bacillus sp. TS-2]
MKKTILASARELFIKKGYTATSMGDIVKAANTSKGNLYYHFTNKEHLFLDILEKEEDRWARLWTKYEKECSTAYDKFIRLAEFSGSTQAQYPMQMALAEFYAKEHDSDLIKEKLEELEQRFVHYYHKILEEGVLNKEWTIEEIDEKSEMASAAFTGLDICFYLRDEKERIKLFKDFAHVFLKGMMK